jgi:hypothetical protein
MRAGFFSGAGGELFAEGAAFANGARCAPVASVYGRKVWESGGGNGSCHGEACGSLPVLSQAKGARFKMGRRMAKADSDGRALKFNSGVLTENEDDS